MSAGWVYFSCGECEEEKAYLEASHPRAVTMLSTFGSVDVLMYNQLEFDRECRGEQLIVCPLSNVLLSVSKRPNCAKINIGIKSPVLVKTPMDIQCLRGAQIDFNCLTSDGTLNITSAVVKGVGEFKGIDMCDVVSEEFKVPARIHGSSVFSEQISEIVFPNVEEIYTAKINLAFIPS
ncbi:hypothetical protein J6590_067230 [Homalodisca vitripennis]|nr:hypothetical protein J6590_067230 [Homalodisca vitripennis]